LAIAPSHDTAGDEGFRRVLTVMELASGDEKHDPSKAVVLTARFGDATVARLHEKTLPGLSTLYKPQDPSVF